MKELWISISGKPVYKKRACDNWHMLKKYMLADHFKFMKLDEPAVSVITIIQNDAMTDSRNEAAVFSYSKVRNTVTVLSVSCFYPCSLQQIYDDSVSSKLFCLGFTAGNAFCTNSSCTACTEPFIFSPSQGSSAYTTYFLMYTDSETADS